MSSEPMLQRRLNTTIPGMAATPDTHTQLHPQRRRTYPTNTEETCFSFRGEILTAGKAAASLSFARGLLRTATVE